MKNNTSSNRRALMSFVFGAAPVVLVFLIGLLFLPPNRPVEITAAAAPKRSRPEPPRKKEKVKQEPTTNPATVVETESAAQDAMENTPSVPLPSPDPPQPQIEEKKAAVPAPIVSTPSSPKPESEISPPPALPPSPSPAAVPMKPALVPLPDKPDASFSATLGKLEVFMRNGQDGFRRFPCMQIAFISVRPTVRLLMPIDGASHLMEGKDLWSLQSLKVPIKPGPLGSPDNDFVQATGAVFDPQRSANRLFLCLQNGDSEGMRPNMESQTQNTRGYYLSISAAESFDGGANIQKLGPIIASHTPKTPMGKSSQGCVNPCLLLDKEKKNYLVYYNDHGTDDQSGFQIHLARSPVRNGGGPKTWQKYYEGSFSQPGLLGKSTPVLSGRFGNYSGDAQSPSVAYFATFDKYVMVYAYGDYDEYGKDKPKDTWKSGLYLSISGDGIVWTNPVQLSSHTPPHQAGKEHACFPTLVPLKVSKTGFQGYVLFSYSERYGDEPVNVPFYFVGKTIDFSLKN